MKENEKRLLKLLSIFVQTKVLTPHDASYIAKEYKNNNKKPLEDFVYSPNVPMEYSEITKQLLNL